MVGGDSESSTVCIYPSKIYGKLLVPPSKSAAHRALLCAALAGSGTVRGLELSDDIAATRDAVAALGVQTANTEVSGRVNIHLSAAPLPQEVTVDCCESGTTLRLMLPLLAARGVKATLIGRGRLPQRPLGAYTALFPDHGISLTSPDDGRSLPLRLCGRLTAGRFALAGDVSSQFVSGLLLALPLCAGDSEITLTSPLQSAPYVEMTLEAQRRAGIRISESGAGWRIPGGQIYRPVDQTVEGDWSQAAFLLAAGALAGSVTVTGLDSASTQGDRKIVPILRRFGAHIAVENGAVTCSRAPLHACAVDVSQIPDLAPVLAIVASQAAGVTRITGGARLRLKESDRLAALADVLRTLGVPVEEQADGLTITGVPGLAGGVCVHGHDDHRIVMSLAVAALACRQPLTIAGADCVAKSWPTFFKDFTRIGGDVHVE